MLFDAPEVAAKRSRRWPWIVLAVCGVLGVVAWGFPEAVPEIVRTIARF